MRKLKKLGIECKYDPQQPDTLHYLITINQKKIRNPKEYKKYCTKIINAISNDAIQKESLEHLTISVGNQHLGPLQDITRGLIDEAKKQKRISEADIKDGPLFQKIFIYGGMVIGGFAGFVSGYGPMAKGATYLAKHINNNSYLWAPLTGVVQSGISILGTLATTYIGVLFGAIGCMPFAAIYNGFKTPLSGDVPKYESLETALSQAATKSSE